MGKHSQRKTNTEKSALRLLVICGMSDGKLRSKIAPLVASNLVSEIVIARRQPIAMNKTRCIGYLEGWLGRWWPFVEIYRFFSILYHCLVDRTDLVLGFYLIPHGCYAWLAGIIARTPVIQMIIGNDLDKALKYPILLSIVKQADLIGTRGGNSSSKLTQSGVDPGRLFSPPNIMDFSPYANIGPKSCKDIDLIYIGYFSMYKRIDLLLDVVARLCKRYPDLGIALLGDGVLFEQMKAYARELGIEENVTFLGWQKNPIKWLQRSRIFVMTSDSEGLPMAMIEALSCGLPVVVPDVGDITTVARHEYNALIVNRGGVDGFVAAISRLLENEKLYDYLSQNALRLKKEKAVEYSLGNVRKIWEHVFQFIGVSCLD